MTGDEAPLLSRMSQANNFPRDHLFRSTDPYNVDPHSSGGDRVKGYVVSVVSDDLTDARVTHGYNHSSNGFFHFIFLHHYKRPKGNVAYIQSSASYNILSLSNTLVASLSFVLGRNHAAIRGASNQEIDRFFLVEAFVTRLLITGALGGYSLEKVVKLFSRFTVTFICSRGGRTNDIVSSDSTTGAQYYKWSVGPFDINLIDAFNRPAENSDRLYTLLSTELERKLAAADTFGISEDANHNLTADNSDIKNFQRDYLAAKSEGTLDEFRREIFKRRIDEVTFKFFPRYKCEGSAMSMRPMNYQLKPINRQTILSNIAIHPDGDQDYIANPIRLNNADYDHRDPNNKQFTTLNAVTVPVPSTQFAEKRDNFHVLNLPAAVTSSLTILGNDVRDIAHTLNNNPTNLSINTMRALRLPTIPRNREVRTQPVHDYYFQPVNDFEETSEEQPGDERADINLNVNDDITDQQVGCRIGVKDRIEAYFQRLSNLYCSPFDINDNNCFFRCLLKARRVDFESSEIDANVRFHFLRQQMGIDATEHVKLSHLQAFSNVTNEVYHIYNIVDADYKELADHPDIKKESISKMFKKVQTFTPLGSDEDQRKHREHIHFLWYREHCYLILDPRFIVDKVKCVKCTQWVKLGTFKTHFTNCHYCNICRKSYSIKNGPHTCEGERVLPREQRARAKSLAEPKVCEDWIPARKHIKAKKLTRESDIWLADIETFPDPHKNFAATAYAIGLQCLEVGSRYYYFYGPHCMEEFLTHAQKISGTLYFYNGGRFDAYIVIRGMIDAGFPLESSTFIKNGGTIMNFHIHPRLKVHDLYLFIDCSLAAACKAWGVPDDATKSSFDHSKVYDFESAEKHRKEVLEYLRLDVAALRELYRIYSKAQFECFGVDVNRAVSLSEFAYNVWSTLCPVMNHISVPHTGKEEDDDRAAYYGGRVTPQRVEFQSSEYVEGQKEYDFDEITDYLIYPDVNSLYPAVCRKFAYAIGPWRYVSREEMEGLNMIDILNARSPDHPTRPVVPRSCFKVSVKCPKDIITAFLVERKPDGSLVHTLDDKVEQWYWGNEIAEAVTIGYEVTAIHEMKEFPFYAQVFDAFVDLCWQGRINNPKPSIKNRAFKDTLNKLTGKFGQKAHPVNTTIWNSSTKRTEKSTKAFLESLEGLQDFEIIFSESGKNHAAILEILNKNPHPTYPVYLSAQILANSRVYMSRIYRALNAYRDPNYAIYYTDTDSLILHARCLPILRRHNLIGDGLGQLSCDLTEPFDGDFAKILTGVWAAPKGPYSLGFVTNKKPTLMEKIKSKGIPHPSGPFPFGEDIDIEANINSMTEEQQKEWGSKKEILERVFAYIKDPTHCEPPVEAVGLRFYLWQDADGAYFAKHMNRKIIQAMVYKEGTITCYYGSFKKNFRTPYGTMMEITPSINTRTPCKSNWWLEKSNRAYLEDADSRFDLTYPLGYEPPKQIFV